MLLSEMRTKSPGFQLLSQNLQRVFLPFDMILHSRERGAPQNERESNLVSFADKHTGFGLT